MSDAFKALGLNDQLVANVSKMGYETPSPIQQEAIPVVLSGRDVLGSAQTGTGKTAAFVLPILQRLERHAPHVRVLIVAPTRELTAQIAENIEKYAVGTGITSTVVVGGVGFEPQLKALRRGVDIVVATPGRLLDHLQQGNVFLGKVEVLVLDEMDQMLDMGFIPDIRRIVSAVKNRKQTLLFSATVPDTIASLIREITTDPVRVSISRATRTADNVTMQVVVVPKDQKKAALMAFLQLWTRQQVLVFTRTKRGADGVARFLEKTNHRVGLIHGDRSQGQRTRALSDFKTKRTDILVATSIAARGLDIPEVSHVVNYDLPSTPEEYIHRVGRTARAEATGEAFTFATPDQLKELRDIERVLGKPLPRAALPALPDLPASLTHPQPQGRGGHAHGAAPYHPPQQTYSTPAPPPAAARATPAAHSPRPTAPAQPAQQRTNGAPLGMQQAPLQQPAPGRPLAPARAMQPHPVQALPQDPTVSPAGQQVPTPGQGYGWKIFSPRAPRSAGSASRPAPSGTSAAPQGARGSRFRRRKR